MLVEDLSSVDLGHVSNQLEHAVSHSPLRVFGHVADGGEERRRQQVRTDGLGNLDHSSGDVETHIRVVVLDQIHEDGHDLLNGVVLANDVGHFAESRSHS